MRIEKKTTEFHRKKEDVDQMISLTRLIVLAFLVASLISAPPQAVAAERKYQVTTEEITLPDVVLVNQDGKKVRLKTLEKSGRPVIVDFIYGTCTTICPVLSAGYANLQRKLGADSAKVHLVSFSIDPENDSPKVMKEYLKRYQAKPGWDFFTGSRRDIDLVLKSFRSNFRDKMDHKPLTFIHLPSSGKWVRIFGLISTSEFMEECRRAGIVL